jgi:hypothetical protein
LREIAPKSNPVGSLSGHDYVMGNWLKVLRYGVIEAVREFCVERDWDLVVLTSESIENQSFSLRRIGA